MKRLTISTEETDRNAAISEVVDIVKKGGVTALKVNSNCKFSPCSVHIDQHCSCLCMGEFSGMHALGVWLTACVLPTQTGGLSDRLAEAANSTTDPLARQGTFEAYTSLIKEIGAPIEPFVALVLAPVLDRCSDKVLSIDPSAL
jgi:hypothetical protein